MTLSLVQRQGLHAGRKGWRHLLCPFVPRERLRLARQLERDTFHRLKEQPGSENQDLTVMTSRGHNTVRVRS